MRESGPSVNSPKTEWCNVVPLVPERHRLALVRCDGCGAEWADINAAMHGYSERGCPNGCGRSTTPVYEWVNGRGWVR